MSDDDINARKQVVQTFVKNYGKLSVSTFGLIGFSDLYESGLAELGIVLLIVFTVYLLYTIAQYIYLNIGDVE